MADTSIGDPFEEYDKVYRSNPTSIVPELTELLEETYHPDKICTFAIYDRTLNKVVGLYKVVSDSHNRLLERTCVALSGETKREDDFPNADFIAIYHRCGENDVPFRRFNTVAQLAEVVGMSPEQLTDIATRYCEHGYDNLSNARKALKYVLDCEFGKFGAAIGETRFPGEKTAQYVGRIADELLAYIAHRYADASESSAD